MKKTPAVDAPAKLPINLDYEDDSISHVNWLRDQQASLDEFHQQVMKFIQPQQADLKTKWRVWWDRIYKKYNLDPNNRYQLRHLNSRWATLDELPPDTEKP